MKSRLKVKKRHERRCRRKSEYLYVDRLFDSRESTDLWNLIKMPVTSQYSGPLTNSDYTLHLRSIAEGKYPFSRSRSDRAVSLLAGLQAFFELPKPLEWRLLSSFPSNLLNPKRNKACGSDGWFGKTITILKPAMELVLPKIFILCLRSGHTPDQWDYDVKVPVPKPNKPLDNPSSLRPITLVNTLMKQYEKWFLSIIEDFYKEYEEQAGFRKNYSCVSRLFVLRNVIDKYLHIEKKRVYAVLIDFSSFFDTVREEFLCEYLCKQGDPTPPFTICSHRSKQQFL